VIFQTKTWIGLWLLLTVGLGGFSGCSGLDRVQGTTQTIDPLPLSSFSRRSESYLEALNRSGRVADLFDDFTLRISVMVIRLKGPLESALRSEIEDQYEGEQVPPAVESMLESLYPEECAEPLLVRAWDAVRRRDPLREKPRSWEFYTEFGRAESFEPLNDMSGAISLFFPVRVTWSQWSLICVKEPSTLPYKLRVASPGGVVRVEIAP
jgi:hypothetical protein